MINPIQSSVAFTGVEKNQSADKFTGNVAAQKSVRSDYNNAVQSVSDKKMQIQENVGKSLDVIA